jgi:hypothetical protein
MVQRNMADRGAFGLPQAVRRAAALIVAVGLAGCASINDKMAGTLADMPGIGLPTGVPERPAEQLAYPAVHDMPPPRSAAVLTEVEQQKMEDDLVAARDAQQQASSGGPATTKKKAVRPAPRVVPVSSSRTIY